MLEDLDNLVTEKINLAETPEDEEDWEDAQTEMRRGFRKLLAGRDRLSEIDTALSEQQFRQRAAMQRLQENGLRSLRGAEGIFESLCRQFSQELRDAVTPEGYEDIAPVFDELREVLGKLQEAMCLLRERIVFEPPRQRRAHAGVQGQAC